MRRLAQHPELHERQHTVLDERVQAPQDQVPRVPCLRAAPSHGPALAVFGLKLQCRLVQQSLALLLGERLNVENELFVSLYLPAAQRGLLEDAHPVCDLLQEAQLITTPHRPSNCMGRCSLGPPGQEGLPCASRSVAGALQRRGSCWHPRACGGEGQELQRGAALPSRTLGNRGADHPEPELAGLCDLHLDGAAAPLLRIPVLPRGRPHAVPQELQGHNTSVSSNHDQEPQDIPSYDAGRWQAAR
mmetsp:Transcript_40217/g.111739  ORF Transcript_40217/g.111739 Transcript_40217/m.111739 type:complete len:245 (-) Transcript_40217:361-1095(-)